MNREDYFLRLANIRNEDGSDLSEADKQKLWEFNLEIWKNYGGNARITLDDILKLQDNEKK